MIQNAMLLEMLLGLLGIKGGIQKPCEYLMLYFFFLTPSFGCMYLSNYNDFIIKVFGQKMGGKSKAQMHFRNH